MREPLFIISSQHLLHSAFGALSRVLPLVDIPYALYFINLVRGFPTDPYPLYTLWVPWWRIRLNSIMFHQKSQDNTRPLGPSRAFDWDFFYTHIIFYAYR